MSLTGADQPLSDGGGIDTKTSGIGAFFEEWNDTLAMACDDGRNVMCQALGSRLDPSLSFTPQAITQREDDLFAKPIEAPKFNNPTQMAAATRFMDGFAHQPAPAVVNETERRWSQMVA